MLLHPSMCYLQLTSTKPDGHRPKGMVLVNRILHKQGCVIKKLFLVEAMLWKLHMRNNNHKHVNRIRRCCTVILEAD